MKKLFICLAVFVSFFLFLGCDSDENSNASNKVISKITLKVFEYYNEDEYSVLTLQQILQYKNNQVVRISYSNGVDINYNYEGDKLVRVTLDDDSTIKTFVYDKNLMIESETEDERIKFFYDLNEKIGEIRASYFNSGFTEEFSSFYYFNENNITSKLENILNASESTTIYKYDDKNNPFKNHNPYFRLISGELAQTLSKNNVIEESNDLRNIKYTIEYDSDGFPIKSSGIDQNTGKLWTEYSYEYIRL
jgi:hypothetical protein